MLTDKPSVLADIQSKMSELFRASPAADLERNLKALVTQALSRLELVTREEFDIQRELLLKLRAQVAELERKLSDRDTGRD